MLINFMYKGEIEIESAKIASFLDTAKALKIRDLMQHQTEETSPRIWLRVPKCRREPECPAQDSGHDSCQASRSSAGIVHLERVRNRFSSNDNAVEINSLSQSPASERFQTDYPTYAVERDNIQGEGSDSEENSIAIKSEVSPVPHYELFHLEDALINTTAFNESGEIQQSFKQEPQDCIDKQDFNPIPSAFTHNSPSSALEAKSRRKRTHLSRTRRLRSEKQFNVQRKRNVSKVLPVLEAKDNDADMIGDPDDETSSETSQHEQTDDELRAARFEDSDTTGNEANDLEAAGPSGMANQNPGPGISNASSTYNLRKRTSAVILQPSDTRPLSDTSRSVTSTPELSASASTSSVRSGKSKPISGKTRHVKTLHFVRGRHPSFKCVTCDKQLSSKNNLKTHLDVVHKFVQSVCPRCSKSYKWPGGLSRHKRFECGKEPLFACVACDRRFFSRENLKRHVDIVHKSGNT